MDKQIGDLPVEDVHLRGDRIVAVGEHLQVPGAGIVDAAGSVVTPGFIDGHTHGWPSILRALVPTAVYRNT